VAIQPGTAWSGCPKGQKQDPARCIVTVGGDSLWGAANAHQCGRKRGHGPNRDYCRQHAAKLEGQCESR